MENSKTNSANSANQPPASAETNDIPARAMAHRRIDATCIAEMAKLVAKMLTESEACRRLGIRPRAWFDWKSRCGRTEKFGALLEAYRAHRIEHLIERIEKSAEGEGAKYPDWRAALALLKIADQERFGDQTASVEVNVNTGPTRAQWDAALRLAQSRLAKEKVDEITASAEPKQIENAKSESAK